MRWLKKKTSATNKLTVNVHRYWISRRLQCSNCSGKTKLKQKNNASLSQPTNATTILKFNEDQKQIACKSIMSNILMIYNMKLCNSFYILRTIDGTSYFAG